MKLPDIPKIPADTKWGRCALQAMREINQLGGVAWLEKELASPSHDDPEWIGTIAAMKLKTPLPPVAPESKLTYRCHYCRDTDFQIRTQHNREVASRCPWCRERRDGEIRSAESRAQEPEVVGTEIPKDDDLTF